MKLFICGYLYVYLLYKQNTLKGNNNNNNNIKINNNKATYKPKSMAPNGHANASVRNTVSS